MSPEQLEGQQVDGRSDLFSLGAILYSALTGFSPFQGNSATTVCYKVANHEPLEASALAPHLPAELDAVIARALAKDPEKRYQRGTEFARELRQLREGLGSPSRGKLWFSTSAGRPRFLDGTIKVPVRTAGNGAAAARPATHPSKKMAPANPKPATIEPKPKSATVQKTLTLFSSPKVQRTAAVTVFLVAIVLNIYSWRQLRAHRIEPGKRCGEHAERPYCPADGDNAERLEEQESGD
jgi:serine/threonine protein kinase